VVIDGSGQCGRFFYLLPSVWSALLDLLLRASMKLMQAGARKAWSLFWYIIGFFLYPLKTDCWFLTSFEIKRQKQTIFQFIVFKFGFKWDRMTSFIVSYLSIWLEFENRLSFLLDSQFPLTLCFLLSVSCLSDFLFVGCGPYAYFQQFNALLLLL